METPRTRPVGRPDPSGDDALLIQALRLAVRAPSLHNTQPWRWRIGRDRIELHADRSRRLHETDPDHRDLLISCGAALHHLHVALAGLGTATTTDRWPDEEDRDHLATVRLVDGAADPADGTLISAIEQRRTDRRGYRPVPVPDSLIATLAAGARRHDVRLLPVARAEARAAIYRVLGDAADAQRRRPGYLAELMTWTRRHAGAHDGVPSWARPGHIAVSDPLQRFPPGQLPGPSLLDDDGGTLVVLTTDEDDDGSRLAAGEATSAVLLQATWAGLATAPLSQALELPTTRARLAGEALHTPDHPQMIIRLGYAVHDDRLPETPRRPAEAVLMRS